MLKITKQIREFITSNTQLSANARLLYLLLADRAELSEKNKEKFSDEHGIFIYFTVAEVQSVLGCAVATAVKVLDELEHNGFIVRRHTQKADKIYLSHISKIETCTFQKLECADSKNCTLHISKIEICTFQKLECADSKNYNLHISKIETNQNTNNHEAEKSSSSIICGTQKNLEKIRQQVDYYKMIDDDPDSVAILDILIELLVEHYDPSITSIHLKTIIDNVKGKQDITNIRAYLCSCLKNVKADVAVRSSTPAGSVEPDPESDWEQLKRLSVVDEVP